MSLSVEGIIPYSNIYVKMIRQRLFAAGRGAIGRLLSYSGGHPVN